MDFEGDVWRYIPSGNDPTDVQAISEADGRWNRPGVYGCVYTALTKRGALAEYLKAFKKNPSYYRLTTHVLVSLHIEIQNVANLTHWKVQEKYEIDEQTMRTESDPYERCRRVADYARLEGNQGLKVHSAADNDETNVILYPDMTASTWRIEENTADGKRPMIDRKMLLEHFEEERLPK